MLAPPPTEKPTISHADGGPLRAATFSAHPAACTEPSSGQVGGLVPGGTSREGSDLRF